MQGVRWTLSGLGAGLAATGAALGGLFYSGPAGGRRQEHSINGTNASIVINGDMTSGTVSVGGVMTNIAVLATGVDAYGNPTGFVAQSPSDVQRLNNLGLNITGTNQVIDTAPSTLTGSSATLSGASTSHNRISGSIGQIAAETGLSEREVRDRIHEAKHNIPKGTEQRNPDVIVDLDSGEIYPVSKEGVVGDSIGNIHD